MIVGMNAITGRPLIGIDHVRQCIRDILSTPLGSRVMRRDYGSLIFELVDRPMNDETKLKLFKETATAIKRWEPRFAVERVVRAASASGSLVLDLFGEYLPEGRKVAIDGLVVR